MIGESIGVFAMLAMWRKLDMLKNAFIVTLTALTVWGCSNKTNTVRDLNEGSGERIAENMQVGDETGPEVLAMPREAIPLPKVWLEPADLVTRVDEKALQIVVIDPMPPLDPSLLDAVREVIRLTDAQSSPIRFRTLIRQDERFGEYGSIIQVIPDEPLKEGWYVLSLARIPEGIAEPPAQNYPRSEDGAISVRFRTDSWPILRGVTVASDEKLGKVILGFSEPMRMIDSLERAAGLVSSKRDNPCVSLTFEEDGIICLREDKTEELLDMSNRAKMAGALEKLAKVTSPERDIACQSTLRLIPDNIVSEEVLGVYDFDWLHLTCTPTSDQDKLMVEIPPGLVSLEGIELKGPLVHQFVVGEVEEHGNGARYYRASIVE